MSRNYTKFTHHALTTLPTKIRRIIWAEMSYFDGGMQHLLRRQQRNVKVCLVHYRNKLMGWVAMEMNESTCGLSYHEEPCIIAWTRAEERQRGVASAGVKEMLRRYRNQLLNKDCRINAYDGRIVRLIRREGFESDRIL